MNARKRALEDLLDACRRMRFSDHNQAERDIFRIVEEINKMDVEFGNTIMVSEPSIKPQVSTGEVFKSEKPVFPKTTIIKEEGLAEKRRQDELEKDWVRWKVIIQKTEIVTIFAAILWVIFTGIAFFVN